MNLEETTQLYASVLRQLLPVGGYDASPNTEGLAVDIYAHAKLLAQADLDAKRLLNVLEAIPPELINEYEAEYGLPLKCTVNASRTFEERLQILNWVRTSRNVLNQAYLEQLLAIFGVTLIDIQKFKPIRCTSSCIDPVNTEQLRYKVFLRLQYPMNADMSCIVENYLPGYLRIEWMVDMPWGDWILNPDVTVNTNGVAHYTAYKTNQREYYDSYADLDLTQAIVLSLHDADMQQWQAVKDAANELTGVTDWVLDPANNQIKYKDPDASAPTNCSSNGSDCPSSYYLYFSSATGASNYFSTLEAAIKYRLNKESSKNSLVSFNITTSGNPTVVDLKYSSSSTTSACYKTPCSATYAFNRLVNPNYDANAEEENRTKTLPLETVAQQVISNASSSNQAISLLAEAYLEAVATSIFNTDPSKQFVKLSDLLSQFELNKTLRT